MATRGLCAGPLGLATSPRIATIPGANVRQQQELEFDLRTRGGRKRRPLYPYTHHRRQGVRTGWLAPLPSLNGVAATVIGHLTLAVRRNRRRIPLGTARRWVRIA